MARTRHGMMESQLGPRDIRRHQLGPRQHAMTPAGTQQHNGGCSTEGGGHSSRPNGEMRDTTTTFAQPPAHRGGEGRKPTGVCAGTLDAGSLGEARHEESQAFLGAIFGNWQVGKAATSDYETLFTSTADAQGMTEPCAFGEDALRTNITTTYENGGVLHIHERAGPRRFLQMPKGKTSETRTDERVLYGIACAFNQRLMCGLGTSTQAMVVYNTRDITQSSRGAMQHQRPDI